MQPAGDLQTSTMLSPFPSFSGEGCLCLALFLQDMISPPLTLFPLPLIHPWQSEGAALLLPCRQTLPHGLMLHFFACSVLRVASYAFRYLGCLI